MTHFGELLKEARIRAGLTQQELAKKVGINHSYISKMENEDFLPSHDKAERLADALGMSEGTKTDFLLEAKAAGKEDLKGYILVKVADRQIGRQGQGSQQTSADEDEDSEAGDGGAQVISTRILTTILPALKLPDSLQMKKKRW
jgi:transcriptional regulator with XRE-family HTH domain